MEKFRPYGDAATGINPFISVVSPTTAGLFGSFLMYPMRLLFCALLAALLTAADALVFALAAAGLRVVARGLLLTRLQRLCLRGVLFFIGHVLPSAVPAAETMRPTAAQRKEGVYARALAGPQPGEVVVCNLQSVWDVLVLEVGLGTPFFTAAFPPAQQPSASAAAAAAPVVFYPGLFSRWAVWRHIRRTGTAAYLAAVTGGDANTATAAGRTAQTAVVVDLSAAMWEARRRGGPLVYFGEGTCSNGKGVLRMDSVRLAAAAAKAPDGGGAADKLTVWAAPLQYDTPAVHSILTEGQSVWSTLYRAGCLLYGSLDRQWESPFFPSAVLTCHFIDVPLARYEPGEDESTSNGSNNSSSSGSKKKKKSSAWRGTWVLPEAAMQTVRQALCTRGRVAVLESSSSLRRRQPLAVGAREKLGFLRAHAAMMKEHTDALNAKKNK